MAPRRDNNTARDIVSDTLGLTADDLGMDRANTFGDIDDQLDSDLDQDDDDLEGDLENDLIDDDDDLSNIEQPPQRRQERQPDPQRRQQPNQQQPDNLQRPNQQRGEFDIAKFKTDQKGNILSPDGKRVIATAGREARMFTTLHQRTEQLGTIREAAQNTINEVDNRLKQAVEIGTTLHKQLTTLQQQQGEYQRAGLSDSENREAVELASMFKRSPIDAIKTMLTRAAARGIDMTTLGLQPGGFDPAALLSMVRTEMANGLAPVKQFQDQSAQQREQQNNNTQAVEGAKRELSQFLIANPDAKEHLVTIQKIYENPQFQNMPLTEVWLRLQLNLAGRRQSQQHRNGGHPSGRLRNRQQQPRLPNGRGNPSEGGNGDGRRPIGNEPAPISMSYDDILRDVMKATG